MVFATILYTVVTCFATRSAHCTHSKRYSKCVPYALNAHTHTSTSTYFQFHPMQYCPARYKSHHHHVSCSSHLALLGTPHVLASCQLSLDDRREAATSSAMTCRHTPVSLLALLCLRQELLPRHGEHASTEAGKGDRDSYDEHHHNRRDDTNNCRRTYCAPDGGERRRWRADNERQHGMAEDDRRR